MAGNFIVSREPYSSEFLAESRSHVVVAVGVTFIVLELVGFALRIVARRVKHVPTGLDDIFAALALVSNLALCIMVLVEVPYGGLGHHTITVLMDDPNKLVFFAKSTNLIVPCLDVLAVVLSRGAILCFFLRIFIVGKTRYITYALCVITIIHGTVLILTILFQCTPMSKIWNTTTTGYCINIKAFFAWCSLLTLIIDVIMMILPMPTILNMKLNKQVKIGVVITLLTASIGMVTAIVRLLGFLRTDFLVDPTWLVVDLGLYTMAEPGGYFLASCFPVYRSLITYISSDGFLSNFNSWYRMGSDRSGNVSGDKEDSGGIFKNTDHHKVLEEIQIPAKNHV